MESKSWGSYTQWKLSPFHELGLQLKSTRLLGSAQAKPPRVTLHLLEGWSMHMYLEEGKKKRSLFS